MKILIVTGIYPPDIGGPATYSKLILENLGDYKIETDIVVFSDLKKYPRIIRHILFFFRILKKSRGIDLYYAQDPVSVGLPTMVASFISRKKYLLKIVGDYAWEQGCQKRGVVDLLDDFSKKEKGYGFFVSLLKKIQKLVANRALRVIVPSNYLKDIVTNWGVPADNISVIYNSFDFKSELIAAPEAGKELEAGIKTLISVGRLVPWKGFDTLIEVVGKMEGINLIIVGSGPDRLRLKEIIESGNYSNVRLLGGLDQSSLFKCIAAADAFILNTSYEGFSHQLLEVMAIGVPIITTAVGGNPELIESEKNGLLFEYNSRDEIRSVVTRILDDKEFSKQLVDNSKLKVKNFSKNRMLQDLANLINQNK